MPPLAVLERIDGLGRSVGVDAFAALAERALVAGFGRAGRMSCGGATRLVRCRDGWIAVSLARPDDLAALPAWLGVDAPSSGTEAWTMLDGTLAGMTASAAIEGAVLLGLPAAALGECGPDTVGPVVASRVADASPLPSAPLVADLSSLWAGPLCARVLRHHGAQVIKVESLTRPDGARKGPTAFFDLLNGGSRSVAVDVRHRDGVALLERLLTAADVVIEASRPRALEQLGIDAAELVAHGPRVWVSITGHGRVGTGRERVAFGDDAAAAGGLVAVEPDGRPCFFADAVADPLTGLVAAGAALDALAAGGRWLLDVAMARVAAAVASAADDQPWARWDGPEPEPPAPPTPTQRGPRLGEHTASVVEELGGT